MKCINCQREINEITAYCHYCGKPMSIVPDYSIYDDDNIHVMLEGAETVLAQKAKEEEILFAEQKRLAEEKRIATEQKKEELKKACMLEKKKKKQIQLTISVVALVCVLLVIAGVYAKFAIDNRNNTSYDYQMKMAETAENRGEWEDAVDYYKKALEIDNSSNEARLELAELYFKIDDDEAAVVLLHEIVETDTSAYEAYKLLLGYYEEKEDLGAIVELVNGTSNNRVRNLFKNYIVDRATVQLKGGTYMDSIRIVLSSKLNTTIYYTIDGTDPIEKGEVYTTPIVFDKKGTYTLKAVVKNEKGVYSDVISEKYILEMTAPDDPIITLTDTEEQTQGGTFSEETSLTIFVPMGCVAYYTWDNTEPTEENGIEYTEPIIIPEGHNILSVVIIDKENEVSSAVFRGSFDYYPAEIEE